MKEKPKNLQEQKFNMGVLVGEGDIKGRFEVMKRMYLKCYENGYRAQEEFEEIFLDNAFKEFNFVCDAQMFFTLRDVLELDSHRIFRYFYGDMLKGEKGYTIAALDVYHGKVEYKIDYLML